MEIKNQPFDNTSRDGSHQSAWQNGLTTSVVNSELEPNALHDVLIIGGGITGLTAALLLQNAGKKCLLVDMNSIGYGTTGGTSAHINTFADTTYTILHRVTTLCPNQNTFIENGSMFIPKSFECVHHFF